MGQSELKPCPFGGSDLRIGMPSLWCVLDHCKTVICNTCEGRGPASHGVSGDEDKSIKAIAAWNRRSDGQ